MKYYIGIDIGGTNLAVGLVTEEGKLLCKDSVKTNAPRPAEEICRDVADLCRRLLAGQGLSMAEVTAVGAGCPGIVRGGIVHRATNLRFREAPVARLLAEGLGCPVTLANDGDAAAYGEYVAGCGHRRDPFVVVTIGTGIGGGIIIDGKIRSGFNGGGGEVGHMVIRAGGKKCACGKVGCFETYCSANALKRDTWDAMKKNRESLMWNYAHDRHTVTGRTVFQAAAQGDPAAQKLLDRYIDHMAIGLKNLIALLEPRVLCLGGGVSNEEDGLMKPLAQRIGAITAQEGDQNGTELRTALLKNDAGIIGAALLGKQAVEEQA